MFDIGFLELLIIGVVGLLVLGPERLPKAARTTGLWIGKIKRTVSGMQREINAQLEAEELRQKLDEQQKKINAGLDKARRDVEGYVETPPPSGTPQASASAERVTRPGASDASTQQAEHEPVEPATSPTDTASADDKDSASR